MRISRFEDLLVWQKAKALSVAVYRVCATGPLARDFGLRDQMQRAAVSIMSNIAEGFDRNSRAEFARYLAIAKGSAGELRSHLYVAAELGFVEPEDFQQLRAACFEVSAMIVALRKSIGA